MFAHLLKIILFCSDTTGGLNYSMRYQNKSVLVTGAGGFIGSHLVESLLAEGAKVTALHRYTSRASMGWLEDVPINNNLNHIFGDVADLGFLRHHIDKIDIVFHLAALIGIPYSYHAPGAYVQTNITGTLNLLELSRDFGFRLIHTSTSEVYGSAQEIPMSESHPLSPQSPYAATKMAADSLVLSYCRSFESNALVLRPFNTYGPRQSMRAVIPTVLQQLAQGQELRLGALSPQRDFVFVDDTVEAFCLAGLSGCTNDVIHTGTGQAISIGDMVKKACDVLGVEKPDILQDSNRFRPDLSEVMHLQANPEKAQKILTWKSVWNLENGLKKTWEWIKNHPEKDSQSYKI